MWKPLELGVLVFAASCWTDCPEQIAPDEEVYVSIPYGGEVPAVTMTVGDVQVDGEGQKARVTFHYESDGLPVEVEYEWWPAN